MDQQLQQFVNSLQTLADIRNLGPSNPVILKIEQPVTGHLFTVVAAEAEPSYLGIPIYVTWVVIDPASQYHLKALQLVSKDPPGSGNLAGFTQSWLEIQNYDEIFSYPQYYDNGADGTPGPPGPAGPQGPQGPKGDPPVVDYPHIVQLVLAALGP